MNAARNHGAVVTDSLELQKALQAAREALERLAALSGTDSHVSVRLSMPWEAGDDPTLRLEIASVRERVNRSQRVLDIREWSGPTAEAIAAQLMQTKCVCERCERDRAQEIYDMRTAREPLDFDAQGPTP